MEMRVGCFEVRQVGFPIKSYAKPCWARPIAEMAPILTPPYGNDLWLLPLGVGSSHFSWIRLEMPF